MFDSLKKIKELKELSNLVSKQKIEIEKKGIRLVINGKMEIEEIKLNPGLSHEDQENILKDCFNEAMKKFQLDLIEKMSQM